MQHTENHIAHGFNTRTIKKVLSQKLKDWIASITDDDLALAVERDVIVTGGSIASMLTGESIKDYDVYFATKQTTEAVAKYYVRKFIETKKPINEPYVTEETITNIRGEAEDRITIRVQSAGIAGEQATNTQNYEYFESGQTDGSDAEAFFDQFAEETEGALYRPIFMSQNAITLSNKLQVVIRFFGSPEEIHRNYDFDHCKCWYRLQNNHLELLPSAMESLLSRTIHYTGSLYPLCSMFRLRKFIDRGWRVSAGEMLKIGWQISELNLNDMATLREQLTGVDAAYFHELIRILTEAKKPTDEHPKGKDINSTYIATIIDRVFST